MSNKTEENKLKTKFTELVGIEHPIMQGGMQYMSLSELASEVSNAGGLGTVPSMAFPDGDALRAEVQKMKSLTDKPFAFNISLVPEVIIPDKIFEYINILIDEGVPVVETSGQRPGKFIEPLKEAGVIVVHKVTSIRHAKSAIEDGADAISIIGTEAGGHPGLDEVAGHILWALAAEAFDVPVLAGGGIVDGKSYYMAIASGVDGVLMGTRFLATPEINTSDAYRKAILTVPENGTVLTMKALNNAMRVARNEQAEKILEKEKGENVTFEDLAPLVSGRASYEATMEGRLDEAQMSMGQGIGRVNDIKTVAEIFEELVQGFDDTHMHMSKLLED